MVKHEYRGRRPGRAEAAHAERLAARTWEFSQFLVRRLGRTTFESDVEGPLAYHDSCHLLRGLHEGATPRTLLNNLSGAAVVPVPCSDEWCGFGGSFSVRLPEVSPSILERKLANLEAPCALCLVAWRPRSPPPLRPR